ncbi:MAG: FAD-dependent monooxygenase [Mesorhizobium sp.]|nr:FAD-dependent monooxygenase [Mesorhizobium sp.]MBL8575763.1 FAD-dependent monooxygenase [Mesorhizobium sp.]
MAVSVLVVGAGPVGLTMALELARYKVPVRLIEKATRRAQTSRAIAIWPRTLELLDRAGASRELVEAGVKVTAAEINAGDKQIARIPLNSAESPHKFVLMLPQCDTEAILQRRVEAAGIRCEFGVELKRVTQDEKGVDATIAYPDGRVETEGFDWAVACDGAHSTIRHNLGLSFDGDMIDTDWGLGDFYLTGAPFGPDKLSTYWHKDGPIIYFPLAANRYRIVASLGPSKGDKPIPPTAEDFQALVTARGPSSIKLDEPLWLSAFRINERQVQTYRSGRIFLAGDAAHVHSPAGGQGMNTGMQDAFNLAWKLALTGRGMAAPALLDSYSPERHAIGAEVIASAGKLTKMALISNPILQDMRNHIAHLFLGLPLVQHAVAAQMTEISVGYPDSSLNGSHGGSGQKPGTRMPPIDSEMPYGSGDTPFFTLRASEPPPFNHPLVNSTIRPAIPANDIALVRPDGYLAMSARAGDWDSVRTYLDRLRSAAR